MKLSQTISRWSNPIRATTSALTVSLSLGLAVLSVAPAAQARSYDMTMGEGFIYHWMRPSASNLAHLPTQCPECRSTPRAEVPACTQTYQRIVDKRSLEIRLGFGYMDVSDGKDYIYLDKNFGKSMSRDIFLEYAMRKALTASCFGNLEACGFDEDSRDPQVLRKTVRGPSGESIDVVVRMQSSSLTPFYLENMSRADEQADKTRLAEENFFGGIKEADAVFYVGHSRNGGGADFNPPILRSNGHPNYAGYYMKKKPGLNRILSEMKKPGPNPILFGHLSCMSEKHFGAKLRAVTAKNPAGLLLTDAEGSTEDEILSQDDDLLKSAYASIDSLMRFQCRSGFRRALDSIATNKSKTVFRNFLGAPAR